MNYQQLAAIATEVAACAHIDRVAPSEMKDLLLEAELHVANLGINGLPSPEALPFLIVVVALRRLQATVDLERRASGPSRESELL